MAVEGTFIAEQKGAACRGRGRPPRPEDNVEKEWKGMEKLTEQNRAEVEAYISAEPEYNVFVQGDLENYGFESKTVEISAHVLRTARFVRCCCGISTITVCA